MITYQEGPLTVFQSALYQTNSSVIETPDAVILCDPTWLSEEIETIQTFLASRMKEKPLYLIFTHNDFDHILGAGAFPEAITIATKEFIDAPEKEAVMRQIKEFDQQYYVRRNYVMEYPDIKIVVENDEQKLVIGSTTLTFYKAPGHTKDGLFTVIEPQKIFLAGDYLSDVEFPFIGSGYREYEQTLKKAARITKTHAIQILIPGHGSVATASSEINNRLFSSTDYLNRLEKDNGELEKELKKTYRFYEGMKNIHEENLKQAQKER